LAEARDDFLKAGQWTRAALDAAMQHAFQRATELAPDRFAFAYRFAESFYDLERPDWEAALKAWSTLEEKAPTPVERQTMRLHAANICLKTGRLAHARALLETVDEPALQGQKARLLPQLAEAEKALTPRTCQILFATIEKVVELHADEPSPAAPPPGSLLN
jgi:hypothetical protein